MGPKSLQNLQLDGALIGTFWKLCMFWLNYICALRQFLCKIILLKWTTEVSQRFPYNQANTIVWKFSRLSRNLPDYLESVQKLSRLSRNFPGCLETFHTIRKLFRLPGNFPDNPETFHSPETFQTVCKLSRLSGNFLDCPQSFQTIWKLSRRSGNFQDCLETFQTFRKLSSCLETLQTVW